MLLDSTTLALAGPGRTLTAHRPHQFSDRACARSLLMVAPIVGRRAVALLALAVPSSALNAQISRRTWLRSAVVSAPFAGILAPQAAHSVAVVVPQTTSEIVVQSLPLELLATVSLREYLSEQTDGDLTPETQRIINSSERRKRAKELVPPPPPPLVEETPAPSPPPPPPPPPPPHTTRPTKKSQRVVG